METIKDYQKLCELQKRDIECLQYKVENFESIQRGKCCECSRKAVQDYGELRIEVDCFDDDYFKGLKYSEIAELAKKSVRITSENTRLLTVIEKIGNIAERMEGVLDTEDKNKIRLVRAYLKEIIKITEKESEV